MNLVDAQYNYSVQKNKRNVHLKKQTNQQQKRPARVFGVGLASRGAALRVLRLGGLPHAIFSSSIISASI